MESRYWLMMAGMAVGIGCGSPALESSQTVEDLPVTTCGSAGGLTVDNGLSLNGSDLNGSNLNGSCMNGRSLNRMLVSVRYEGAQHEGTSTAMDDVWLEGSTFHGLQDGKELSGSAFQQVRFIGNLDDGTTLPLRIESVIPGTGFDQDVWAYRVSYQEPTTGQWHPICTAADGMVRNAIPLQGRWDYREGVAGGGAKVQDSTTFTFACEGAALAKCVRFGYAPWRSVNGVSLADHHQACTRLVRADFCGNGTSYTVDGNWVNLYDTASVQRDTESWSAEAEWSPDGAHCFTSTTRATKPVQCAEGRLVATCGGSFSAGTLLISETPTVGGAGAGEAEVWSIE